MIDTNGAKTLVLSLADEDYFLLGEFISVLSSIHPLTSERQRIEIAQSLFLELLAEGLVQLFIAHWPPEGFTAVELAAAGQLVAQEKTWSPQSTSARDPLVWFTATEQGRAAYAALSQAP